MNAGTPLTFIAGKSNVITSLLCGTHLFSLTTLIYQHLIGADLNSILIC
jgi:hypothetical protein